jgi:hypothetical protein
MSLVTNCHDAQTDKYLLARRHRLLRRLECEHPDSIHYCEQRTEVDQLRKEFVYGQGMSNGSIAEGQAQRDTGTQTRDDIGKPISEQSEGKEEDAMEAGIENET